MSFYRIVRTIFILPFIVAGSVVLLAGCNPVENESELSSDQALATDGSMQQLAPSLPDLELMSLNARPVALGSYAGRPVVLNLWATWCPPCRREMPVLEQAQTAFPDIDFVLINQGESAQQAQDFLDSEGLNLTDVLLDPSSEAMRTMRTGGLPTTFFFDAEGQLVDLHLGEITIADLEGTLSEHFD